MNDINNELSKYLVPSDKVPQKYETEKKEIISDIVKELSYQKVELKKIDVIE